MGRIDLFIQMLMCGDVMIRIFVCVCVCVCVCVSTRARDYINCRRNLSVFSFTTIG